MFNPARVAAMIQFINLSPCAGVPVAHLHAVSAHVPPSTVSRLLDAHELRARAASYNDATFCGVPVEFACDVPLSVARAQFGGVR